jgi:hypothetical protein
MQRSLTLVFWLVIILVTALFVIRLRTDSLRLAHLSTLVQQSYYERALTFCRSKHQALMMRPISGLASCADKRGRITTFVFTPTPFPLQLTPQASH